MGSCTCVDRVVGNAIITGTIGVQTKNVFVSPPLTCYPFHAISEQQIHVLNGSSPTQTVDCLCLAHDERILAYATSAAIKLVDLQTGREIRTLHINLCKLRSIYMWSSAATDCTVTLWDTRQHPANVQMRRFDHPINCMRYSPNDAFIALGSNHIHMMDPRVRQYRSLPSSSQVLHICFHPSEYLLAAGSEDRLVRFWDIDSEECVSQSDPADSSLREITFQHDGSALITLTDRKCSAISWEPFEMLGQCIIPKTDFSLGLATTDSEVFVLGQSVLSRNLSLLMLPYAVKEVENFQKLLTQEEIYDDQEIRNSDVELKLKKEISSEKIGPEISNVNELEQSDQNEVQSLKDCYDDRRAFVPTHTLPRTPPGRSVKVLPEIQAISTIIARPRTLKTKQGPASTKLHYSKSGSVRRTNIASSQTNLPSRRGMNSSAFTINKILTIFCKFFKTYIAGTTMKITNSAPDIRFSISKKKEERNRFNEENKRNQICNDQSQESPSKELCSLNDTVAGLDKFEMIISQRRTMLENVLHCWRTRGSDAAITEAGRSSDPSVLVELIDAFNHMPTAWNLTLCTTLLPHIEPLIANKHEDYVEVALNALRTIITGCGDVIRTGSHRRFQIGVDVPAEERHDKCIKCMQQLTNIRVKATLLADHMSKSQSREFTALMQIFDDTLATS
ncbi:unnamed protein product [Thelazia callipaeda]|uniref:WD_REPEATS_REGION domain-containing protein n=1 Tax=Thelazia callipaeda TaxID=103827 RepID=A0A158RAQ9_THECL|nr:unnamed protein product [Thelazia callipaeda]